MKKKNEGNHKKERKKEMLKGTIKWIKSKCRKSEDWERKKEINK